MKKLILLLLTIVSSVNAQNSDTSLISISNFKLLPGTFSWRGTDSFYDMTSWDSKSYTEGHLMQLNGEDWRFRMNYRLLFPSSYDDEFSPGYPLLILLHGAGERGNCWDTECYCENCDANSNPGPEASAEYLNNDHMLQIGGQPFYNAVTLAGSKKPDDPTLHSKAFPGFVLFPQNENSWGPESSSSHISYALRVIRLLIKEQNIDPDRIYISGLSMGGQGVLKALSIADWMFAAAIAMSPIPYQDTFDYEGSVDVPLWIFQGAHDTYPRPAQTETLITRFREAGGSARYTLYGDAGHNTWSDAFKEPDFFSWLLSKKKSDVTVHFEYPFICATDGTGPVLSMSAGFPTYQWEFNGSLLNSTERRLEITEVGTYRGRFSRSISPTTEADWNEWSKPVEINSSNPPPPLLTQEGTTFLPDLNGVNTATLFTENAYPYYFWEKADQLTQLPDSNLVKISSGNGPYKIRVADFSGCRSAPSDPKFVFFDNSAKVNNVMRPSDFTSEIITSSSILLRWNDPSSQEKNYEIWRKNNSRDGSPWELASITKVNLTFYYDTMLIPGSEYFYKIRAINHNERSDYFPGNSGTENHVVNLPSDNDKPSPPQNLNAVLKNVNTIQLSWTAGRDESGIKEYIINYNGQTVSTGNINTTYTLKGLQVNKVYVISVSTVDISNNISFPSNQVTVTSNTSGLFYKHTTGAWNSLDQQTMKASWDNPEYEGHLPNISLDPKVQVDYFNFEFQGYLFIDAPGQYVFYLNSNDGSRLFLDNEKIIDFDGIHGRCTGDAASTTCPNSWGRPSQVLNLSRGAHLFKLQMFEYTGGQDLKIRYNGPDTENITVEIPDDAFTSGSKPFINNPSSPGSPSAQAVGMTSVQISWGQSATSPVDYEVYRSLTNGGPYEILAKTGELNFKDERLFPGTTYYYRIRAINLNGNSSYSSVVNAKTFSDTEAPSTPEDLRTESGNYSKVILRWNSSTDNVAIKGYEIWGNNKLIGFSPVPAFEAVPAESGTPVSFFVIAVDYSNNRSGRSEEVTNENFITGQENSLSPGARIVFYPNPVTSNPVTIIVKTNDKKICKLILADITGKIIQRNEFLPEEEETTIEIQNSLRPGIYVVYLAQGTKSVSEKLVFNK